MADLAVCTRAGPRGAAHEPVAAAMSAQGATRNPTADAVNAAHRPHRSRLSSVLGRSLAAVGALAVGCSAAALSLMQLLPAGAWMDPISTPLSDYALTGAGWWFDTALLLLLVGVLALLGASMLRGLVRIGSFAFAWLGLCAVGLGGIVVFPYDTTAGGLLTMTGWLHVAASVLAFGGPPLACLTLARRHQSVSGRSRLPGITAWLGAFTLGWFAVLATVSALAWAQGSATGTTVSWSAQRTGGGAGTSVAALQYYDQYEQSDQHIHASDLGADYGVIERGLTAAELVIALVLIAWAWRGCRCPTSSPETDENRAGERLMSVGSTAGDSR